ncbi:MAG: hypothetical protein JNM31_07360 [Flavobacteriales bacterium]|nr:hypothetical protein [Flavobacteriales bacterium]
MATFSERIGLKPVRSVIQRESADEPLRNALWNIITMLYWNRAHKFIEHDQSGVGTLLVRFWCWHLNRRYDEMDDYAPTTVGVIKKIFIEGPWNEMFDILEFIPGNHQDSKNPHETHWNPMFIKRCNEILEQYMSAYRFVDGEIVEITSENEIVAIEGALSASRSQYAPVHEHLRRALELLSDREARDYRNSIKESISAVESLACLIAEKPKATLNDALDEIEKKHALHGALKKSFSNLYGYTSDEGGVRHKLLDEAALSLEDATFMLVSCSAFVSYLIAKAKP